MFKALADLSASVVGHCAELNRFDLQGLRGGKKVDGEKRTRTLMGRTHQCFRETTRVCEVTSGEPQLLHENLAPRIRTS